MKKRIAVILIITTLVGCSKFGLYKEDKGKEIVTVGEKTLYQSDLSQLVTDKMSASDSTTIVDTYIQNWIQTQIKLNAAEKALAESQAEIDRLVQLYRNSLLIYKYEDKIVGEKLDTTITSAQIEEYYNVNKDQFKLAGPMVKAVVARIPKDLRNLKKFADLFKKGNENSRLEFQSICQKNSYRYDDYTTNWTDLSIVITQLPFKETNFDEFFKNTKYYETIDSQYQYMMLILDYRPTSSASPIELQTNNIRKIILNSRRVKILDQLNETLLRQAKATELLKQH